MDKLINTDLGGFPFVLDDLRFVDNGIREAFKGMTSAVTDATITDGFIFDKFRPTNLSDYAIETPYSFPATYGTINGEILFIPAQTLVTGTTGDYLCLELDLTYDSDGDKTFEDTTTNSTYEVRRGKFTKKASITTGVDIPIFSWNNAESSWTYVKNGLYNNRVATMFGSIDLDLAVSISSSSITILQNKVNNIESSWTEITPSTIPSHLYLNNSSDPVDFSGDALYSTHPATPSINTADSYLKYKKNGKTLHVDFLFDAMEIPNLDANTGYAMINFDFTGLISGLTSIKKFQSIAWGLESNFSGSAICGLSGNNVEIYAHENKPKAFAMNLLIPFKYSNAFFNKGYNTATFPIASSNTLDTSVFKWTFRGQFTCEIS